MTNFNTLTHNLKRGFLKFSEKITKNLSRPNFKFTSQIIYGMIICFFMFFINDIYGFYNWRSMKLRQNNPPD